MSQAAFCSTSGWIILAVTSSFPSPWEQADHSPFPSMPGAGQGAAGTGSVRVCHPDCWGWSSGCGTSGDTCTGVGLCRAWGCWTGWGLFCSVAQLVLGVYSGSALAAVLPELRAVHGTPTFPRSCLCLCPLCSAWHSGVSPFRAHLNPLGGPLGCSSVL